METRSGQASKTLDSSWNREDLSLLRPFHLGEWRIDPGALTVSRNGERSRIERRLMDLLLCLVEASPGTVEKEALLSRVWGNQIIAEQGLAVAVYELRKALGDSARRPRFIETVPKVGYRLLVRPAEDGEPPAESKTTAASSRIPVIILFATLLSLSLGWWQWTWGNSPGPTGLAVLPLRDLSASEAGRAFAFGFSDALVNQLSTFPNLRVSSLTSVDHLLSRQKTIAEIGVLLDVDRAVEGTIHRRGSRILVSIRVLDARNQASLGSVSVERHIEDLSALPADLAGALAQSLGIQGGARTGQALLPPADPQAFDLYLRGRFLWNRRDPESLRQAYAAFEEASRLQPDLAAAYAGMADCLILSSGNLRATIEDTFTSARQLAEKALALDPSLSNAEASLAGYHFFYGWDPRKAGEHFRRALRINPNDPLSLAWFTEFLSATKRHSEALQTFRRAFDLDPFSLTVRNDLALVHMRARRYPEAAGILEDTAALFPSEASPYGLMAMLRIYQNQPEAALAALRQTRSRREPAAAGPATLQTSIAARRELEETIRNWLAQLQSTPAGFSGFTTRARLQAFLGEADAALSLLETALQRHEPALVWIGIDPAFDSVRPSDRFQRIERQVLGLP